MKELYYKVAEHTFGVQLQDSSMEEMMPNYAPFRVEQVPAPVFMAQVTIGQVHTDTQLSALQHVFTDQSEDDMPRIEVYHDGEDWLFRVSVVATAPVSCELHADASFEHARLTIAQDFGQVRFAIDNALMLLYAFRTASCMTLEMHAAVVVKEGLGYLFLGKSGTGKSTHARQWLSAFPDSWLLNDDNPIIRVMPSGEVRVFGSPWSGKTPCYKNDSAPVGAIVKLSQAPDNVIRPLRLPEAYAYVLSSASGLKIERDMADRLYETIKTVITSVGCYHLDCLPNEDAARLCYGGR